MSDRAERIDTPAGPARLVRRTRKTLAISVLPDGSLELIAPVGASVEAIVARVEKRRGWIARQRQAFRGMNATRPARRYVTGATHRYLGRQYRLKVRVGERAGVLLKGGYLEVVVPTRDEAAVKEALERWYRGRARHQFETRLAGWSDWCVTRKLPRPTLRLLAMPKRWGSAQADGTICLNPALIRAPSPCVDYVIAHEICHLRYGDHGREFHLLLKQLLPDWEQRKARLESGDW
ncbi:MAG: M48 family metallopeptidase [Verrucomicrobiales bacterium]|nr:M48 family metallopeptidase [Verrucomicrobiales bacterium]